MAIGPIVVGALECHPKLGVCCEFHREPDTASIGIVAPFDGELQPIAANDWGPRKTEREHPLAPPLEALVINGGLRVYVSRFTETAPSGSVQRGELVGTTDEPTFLACLSSEQGRDHYLRATGTLPVWPNEVAAPFPLRYLPSAR